MCNIMAKFWMEDDEIISGDRLYDCLKDKEGDDMVNTNTDYITKGNFYDNLVKIQDAINNGELCVLRGLSGKPVDCMILNGERDCSTCISHWLNQKKS